MGISGFNFNFCPECEKDNQEGCDKVVMDYMLSWRKRCEEYWASDEGKAEQARTEAWRESEEGKAELARRRKLGMPG